MSALAEDLLDDLDDLGSEGEDEEEEEAVASEQMNEAKNGKNSDEDGSYDGSDDEGDDLISKVLLQKAKERHSVGSLRASSRFQSQLTEVQRAAESASAIGKGSGSLEDDPEYKLVVSCNRIAQDLDEEMDETCQLVREIYSRKFPELETLLTNKLEYVKTVMRIGNEMDVSAVPLGDLLPSAMVMIISVSASTTMGSRLSEGDWADCLKACNEMLLLQRDKQVVLGFVESRMQCIASNLVLLVGSRVAAQLVGLAGGVTALSKIPACNIEVLGHDKRNLGGLSSLSSKTHFGVLAQCELAQACAGKLRRKAVKLIAAKVTLASRVDSYKNHNDGSEGRKLLQQIQTKMDKWSEPDKARTKKALPVPDEKRKGQRGGKRARKQKERLGMTDLRSQHNKLSFSSLETGEYGDSAMGFGSGLAGLKNDSGRLRAPVAPAGKQKKELHLSKKMKKALTASAGQVTLDGFASSIVQTNSGGFELARPNAGADRAAAVAAANDKWFSANAGFASAAPKG